MRKSANAVVIFMVAGLIGPLILWATWPPVVVLEKLPSIRRFVIHLINLLWPVRPLAVIEYDSGIVVALIVAVGANVIIFAFLGSAVSVASRWRLLFIGFYILLAALVCLYAIWGAGFDLASLNIPALGTALAFLALVFWLSTRLRIF